jgi:hypothetical protein
MIGRGAGAGLPVHLSRHGSFARQFPCEREQECEKAEEIELQAVDWRCRRAARVPAHPCAGVYRGQDEQRSEHDGEVIPKIESAPQPDSSETRNTKNSRARQTGERQSQQRAQ